jgi:hypothetical protein
LFAKPIFGASEWSPLQICEDAVVAGFFCAQQVEDDASELVSRGCDRLRFNELSRDAPEELAQVVFGVVSYAGMVPEGRPGPGRVKRS